MQTLKKFLKRNAPVFIFGLIIALVFLLIILTQPKGEDRTPSDFKRVEEEVFEREPKEPETAEKPTEYAPQIPSPENKGKPYFYDEYDPNLRDEEGYPKPPEPGSTPIPPGSDETSVAMLKSLEYEVYQRRKRVVTIGFTDELGFQPADEVAFTGGRIIWKNNTNRDILIEQTLPIHDALKNGIKLGPGESFEFRPLIDRFFSYVEAESKKYGTISIVDVTRPLVESWE